MKAYCFDIAKTVRPFSNCNIKVGAVLERGGRIINVACNTQGSMGNGHYEYSRHAESRLLRNVNAQGGSVYVYRSHGITGRPLMGKPCKRCEAILAEAGVKRVFFTTNTNQGWEELKLN